MKYGIDLPHAGEQATPDLIHRDAERADDLVWRSACARPNPLPAVSRSVAARARRDRSIHRVDISARIATLPAAARCRAVSLRRRINDALVGAIVHPRVERRRYGFYGQSPSEPATQAKIGV
jgi:hypothetical protein